MEILIIFFFVPFVLVYMLLNWIHVRFFKPKISEHLLKAEAFMEIRDWEEAKNSFDSFLRLYPKSARGFLGRSKCNWALQNVHSALYDIEQSLSYDNTVAEAYIIKGKIHFKLEDYDLAFLEFDKADWHYRSENPVAMRWRGMAHYANGRIKEAKRDLINAAEHGDEDAAFILRTSFSYIKNMLN